MENLINSIPDFLTNFNLVYVIGIISGIASALWAYRKFLYEKQLEKFKDANVNLFKTDKQEVLAAVATLGFFNRDRKFKQNTIDILLSRLYTELDYDITNAIVNALIQYSNRRELKYIADELVGINRNFFFQTSPLIQMSSDLDRKFDLFKRFEINKLKEGETLTEIEKINVAKIKQKLLAEYQKIFPKAMYELLWHKQITSDTYSRIMRKASRESKLFGRKRRLEMHLYQNDFNYTHLAKINTSKCTIDNTALGSALLSDVFFSNIKFIKDSTFSGSSFRNCTFNKGRFIGNSFLDCAFKNVVFNKISFQETFFWGASFSNCRFINCRNADPVFFFEATFNSTDLPCAKESLSVVKNTDAYQSLDNCNAILEMRRGEMKQWLDDFFPVAAK